MYNSPFCDLLKFECDLPNAVAGQQLVVTWEVQEDLLLLPMNAPQLSCNVDVHVARVDASFATTLVRMYYEQD